MRVCSIFGCPAMFTGQDTRCPEHQAQADKARGTARQRGYTSKGHRAFRNGVLGRDPICVLCHAAQATEADHYPDSKRDLLEQGLDSNDPQRGRGLCHTCHARATAADPTQRGGWNNRE